MTRRERVWRAAAVLSGLVFVSCGSERGSGGASADVTFSLEMPHFVLGASKTYINFYWTIAVHGDPGVFVKSVRTQLREPVSAVTLETEDVSAGVPPFGGPFETPTARPPVLVPSDGTVKLNQDLSGVFDSQLYPGAWEGQTSVEVVYPDGRSEQVRASFRFP